MNEKIRTHYKNLFREHGNAPQAVQFSDKPSQWKRFEVLTGIDPEMGSVLDVGCGLGHLYEFLKEKGRKVQYCGVDFVEEFIQENKRRFQDVPDAEFHCIDIKKDPLPEGFDYGIVNGVFNNKSENNEEFMIDMIERLFQVCDKGIAFNAMSTYVDYQDEGLYYVDPRFIFDLCKRKLSKKVTLRHDYLVKEDSIPFEFTIYGYK